MPGVIVEGLAEQAAALAGGRTTSAELVDAHLERIAAIDPQLGAFRVVCAEEARAAARAADERLAAGERAPLLGVPVAVKDDTELEGQTTPFGCGGRHDCAAADAPLVTRLRHAGAVIVGKTATPELGQWPFTEGAGFGTRNPYDPDRTPGGSSGGSAAAVAAGLVPAAVGSDGAGSIRIPAAWCGLVGIKPTRDLVPLAPSSAAFHGLPVHGPLARTVGDAALLLDVLAATGQTHARAAASGADGIAPLRIGLTFHTPWFVPGRVDPAIRSAVLRLAGVLRELGHEVVDAEPRHELAGVLFLPRGMNGLHRAVRASPPGVEFEARTREHARFGRFLGGPLVAAAKGLEPWLAGRMARAFEDVDVLLAPTTAKRALRFGALEGRSYWPTGTAVEAACPFAFAWNVVGWPGVNVPAGVDEGGVPVGAQLLGRAGDEPRLVELAAQLEAVEAWARSRPDIVRAWG